MPPDGSPRRCWPFLNEAPKPRLRRCHPDCGGGVRCRPSMKLRSRDFGDDSANTVQSVTIAPSMKLRSRDFGDSVFLSWSVSVLSPSMKLRSRDFGDATPSFASWNIAAPSMKLRSRDFGDQVLEDAHYFREDDPSMKLRSRDFGDLYPYAMLCALDASPQ